MSEQRCGYLLMIVRGPHTFDFVNPTKEVVYPTKLDVYLYGGLKRFNFSQ